MTQAHRNILEMPDTSRLPLFVRLAEDHEGDIVGQLAAHAGFHFAEMKIDWSHVYPYWLLCFWEEQPAGTVQILPGRPVGRAEIMGIDPSLGMKARVWVARQLITAATLSLTQSGSQFVSALVPDTLPEYRRVLENYGVIAIEDGSIMIVGV